MSDVAGLLLSLPTESIAVRVALASVVGVVLARAVLRIGIRVPWVRVTLALLPAVAIAAVCVAFAADPALPSVWYAVDASGGLTISVRDTYLSFMPMTVPVLVGLWVAVAGVRITLRTRRTRRLRGALETLIEIGEPAPRPVASIVERLSAAMRLSPPEVVVAPLLPGGAAVVGIRNPVLLVDHGLIVSLDHEELVGVLAHELAHIARRDNLVAATLGLLRDLFFFVPGGAWSLRRLLREREHAADVSAVAVTERPGALASGLLKVLEGAPRRSALACSPLLSQGTLVARVEELCDEHEITTVRKGAELTGTVVVLALAVASAAVLPSVAAGAERERDALGVLLSDVTTEVTQQDAELRSPVFATFDDAPATPEPPRTTSSPGRFTVSLDDPEAYTAPMLQACSTAPSPCSTSRVEAHMSLSPVPVVRVDDGTLDRWRLEPLVRSDDQELGVFWFHLLAPAG